MDEPRADLYLVEYFLVAVLVTLRPQLGMKALATSLYTASKGIRTTLGSFAVHRRQAQQACPLSFSQDTPTPATSHMLHACPIGAVLRKSPHMYIRE